jgi:hypothetical protein
LASLLRVRVSTPSALEFIFWLRGEHEAPPSTPLTHSHLCPPSGARAVDRGGAGIHDTTVRSGGGCAQTARCHCRHRRDGFRAAGPSGAQRPLTTIGVTVASSAESNRASPPCRPFKNQSCLRLGSAWLCFRGGAFPSPKLHKPQTALRVPQIPRRPRVHTHACSTSPGCDSQRTILSKSWERGTSPKEL